MLLTLVCARLRRPAMTWRPAVAYSAMAAVVFIPAAYAISIPSPAVPLHLYSPPLVRYLDSQAKRYGLQAGATDYWNARLVTLFSRQGLRGFPVVPSLEPDSWVSNRYWYTGTISGSKKAPDYTFVIPGEPVAVNRKIAVEKMGDPDGELVFQRAPILVYRPSTRTIRQARRECAPILGLSREFLEHAGARLEIPAWCLSGNVGEIAGRTRIVEGPAKEGLLAFGPYLSVPAGRYAVTIYCKVDHRSPGPAATWEIGYFCCAPNPEVTLAHGALENGRQEIRRHISVPEMLAARGMEFRIDYLAAEQVVFEKIVIEREP